jgi:hypothetical protein
MKKPRSDSKLANLPEDVQEEIAGWCKEGLEVAQHLLKAKRGVTIALSSLSAWHGWYRRQEELRQGNTRVQQTLEWFRKHKPNASAEEMRGATFLAMTLMHGEDPQLQLAILKEQGRDLDREISVRRIKLLEDNAAKAKAALEGIKSKGGLTADTLKQIEEAAKLL